MWEGLLQEVLGTERCLFVALSQPDQLQAVGGFGGGNRHAWRDTSRVCGWFDDTGAVAVSAGVYLAVDQDQPRHDAADYNRCEAVFPVAGL